MKHALVVVVLAACGNKPEPPPPTGDPVPEPAAGLPAELARWMPSDAVRAWQGAFTTRMRLRDPDVDGEVAIDIVGDSAKGFDGRRELPLGFSIAAPCVAGFDQAVVEGRFAGAMLTHTQQFVVRDGVLLATDRGVGRRRGKAAIACTAVAHQQVITLDEQGRCRAWELGTWQSAPISCAWSKAADGRDLLEAGASKLVADGDVLIDLELHGRLARHASFAAAKQALAH